MAYVGRLAMLDVSSIKERAALPTISLSLSLINASSHQPAQPSKLPNHTDSTLFWWASNIALYRCSHKTILTRCRSATHSQCISRLS